MKVSEGSKEEIQEVAVSLATANEISQDAVALNGNFTITEEQKMVVFLVRQQTGFFGWLVVERFRHCESFFFPWCTSRLPL